ncbi:MutS-related protein [Clostridium sp. Marseille-Q7071]
MKNLIKKYERRVAAFEHLEKRQYKLMNFISTLRVVLVIISLLVFFLLYRKEIYTLSSLTFIAFLIAFFVLGSVHKNLEMKKTLTTAIKNINKNSIDRVSGKWKHFSDTGEDLAIKNHNYAMDLDILGKGSLFQMINCCNSFLGRRRLKAILCGEVDFSIEEIYERQVAIEELASNLCFMQRFVSEGEKAKDEFKDPSKLIAWGSSYNKTYLKPILSVAIKIFPLITIIFLILPLFIATLSFNIGKILIAFQIILLIIDVKNREVLLGEVFKYKEDIYAYGSMIEQFENKHFRSSYLKKLQKDLKGNENKKVNHQIKELSKIISLIQDRKNFLYFPLNILFLMDYRAILGLENWKKSYGKNIQKYVEVVGEIEALCSLALINHDNPNYSLPSFEKNNLILETKEAHHPLLGEKAVSNSFSLNNINSIALITGSNMSGKSTLLRTIGLNMVLSYSGTKVAASSFKCSKMKIYTCMRIVDNLEESISSFYAEILRVKSLIEASKDNIPIFFLLDEIFKGTNSTDRHIGAKVLINQLSKKNTLGMVSTHDLELCDLAVENSKIKNYNFREYYVDNSIHFDYKLREGVSKTKNALYLLKMAGIEI